MIEFDKLNFLTGKNSAGKSTIIDALQVILLADTSSNYFNKSAKGDGKTKGDRTLSGYLQGEFGEDGDNGFRYLRQNERFSSHIALEFYDDQKKTSFTAGCCFDFYSSNDIFKLFYLFEGEIPSHEFVKNSIPFDTKILRQFIQNECPKNAKITESNIGFRDALYSKLGGLPSRFTGLLRTAIPFNPIVDIEKFVSDFVCEKQEKVNIVPLQDNIRRYKSLENEAVALEKRKSDLEVINNTFDNYRRQRDAEKLYRYLVENARLQIAFQRKIEFQQELSNNIKRIDELLTEVKLLHKIELDTNEECNEKIASLKTNKIKAEIERLKEEKKKLEQRVEEIKKSYNKANQILSSNFSDWKNKISIFTNKFEGVNVNLRTISLVEWTSTIFNEAKSLQASIFNFQGTSDEHLINLGIDGINKISEFAQQLSNNAGILENRLSEEQNDLSCEYTDLLSKQKGLKAGIHQFPQKVSDLKNAIYAELSLRFGKNVRVDILAEVIEIKEDRWRNAIEGYLHSQKYFLLVDPKHFRQALLTYNKIKDEKNIFGIGLVDIGKIMSKNPLANHYSLSEEISTDNPYARAYIDFLLGRVIKCDSVEELRHHSASITDEGMLYQGFVASRINPDFWKSPAIGQAAIIRQLQTIEQRLIELQQQVTVCSSIKHGLREIAGMKTMSQNDAEFIIESANSHLDIKGIQKKISKYAEDIADIDDSPIKALEDSITDLKKQIDEYRTKSTEKNGEMNKLEQKNETIDEDYIPRCEADIENQESIISSIFEQDWIENAGKSRYERELFAKKTHDDIAKNFASTLSTAINRKESEWKKLYELRNRYNNDYKMGYSIDEENNDVYESVWLELCEIALPDYVIKINDAQKKAFEQFQEDFLSRLQSNIREAEDQIAKLNHAIKDYYFDEERYRFTAKPRADYERFYNMIMSNMLLTGGYNLLSSQFNEAFKDEINELFSLITEGGDDFERRVKEFTNYQTYLTFDLEQVDKEGLSQRLSRTLGKKSGGETQTPFYVSVLASFAQLYRIGRDKSDNTIRLIIFDEAFSKMDDDRIAISIEMLKKFGFQVIICAPPGKVAEISPVVDRTLCVIRQDKHSFVASYGNKEIGALFDAE